MTKKCLDCGLEINNRRRRCVRCKSNFDAKVKKRYIEQNRIKHNLATKVWAQKNKLKVNEHSREYMQYKKKERKARNAARYIPINLCCDICGETKHLTKHHWRYDKPLLIATLCKSCHDAQHKRGFWR